MRSALEYESSTCPSRSSVFSSRTSTSSPTLTDSSPPRSVNSSMGIRPSDLYPTSTITELDVTPMMRPVTISPSVRLRMLSSYSSRSLRYSSESRSSSDSAVINDWSSSSSLAGIMKTFLLGLGFRRSACLPPRPWGYRALLKSLRTRAFEYRWGRSRCQSAAKRPSRGVSASMAPSLQQLLNEIGGDGPCRQILSRETLKGKTAGG